MRCYDARAWAVWLLAGGVLAIVVRNPLYLLLLLIISRLVHNACALPATGAFRLSFWRIAGAILLFSTLFNMLTAHVGETVLAALPSGWWLIGGPLTVEAAVYGLITGLGLVAVLSFFFAFNAIVPTSDLAGLIPAALHELGLVMLLAITYVPETARQLGRIREAQAIRGHRLRGLRDWQPIIVPLLVGGLERAMNLAETMVARGFGSVGQTATPRRVRLLLLAGLLLALGGALALAWGWAAGWGVVAGGALAIGLGYRELSRRARRTRYRPRRWTWADTGVVIGALLALAVLVPLPGLGGGELAYTPYPRLTPPPFAVLAGVLLLGLAVPAVGQVRP